MSLFLLSILLLIVPSLSNDAWPAILYDASNTGGSAAKFGSTISADEWTALSTGKSLAIGAPGDNSVRLYTLTDDGTSVQYQRGLTPTGLNFSPTDIMFGQSVSVHGSVLAVGAPCDQNPNAGFVRSGSVSFFLKNLTTGNWDYKNRVYLPSNAANTACTTSPTVSGLGTNVRIIYSVSYSIITATTNNGIIMRINCYRNGTLGVPVIYDTNGVTALATMTGFAITNDLTRTVISSPTSNSVDVFSGSQLETTLTNPVVAGSLYGSSVSIHSWSPTIGDHVIAIGAPGANGGVGAVHIYEYWTNISAIPFGITRNTWNFVETITPPAPDDTDTALGFGATVTLKNTNLIIGTNKGIVYAYAVSDYSIMDSGNRYGNGTRLAYVPSYVGPMSTACWYLYGYDPILQTDAYISLALAGINGTVLYSRPSCAPSYADPLCATRCVLAPLNGVCLDGPNNNGSLSLPPGTIPPQVKPPPPPAPSPPSTTGTTPTDTTSSSATTDSPTTSGGLTTGAGTTTESTGIVGGLTASSTTSDTSSAGSTTGTTGKKSDGHSLVGVMNVVVSVVIALVFAML